MICLQCNTDIKKGTCILKKILYNITQLTTQFAMNDIYFLDRMLKGESWEHSIFFNTKAFWLILNERICPNNLFG